MGRHLLTGWTYPPIGFRLKMFCNGCHDDDDVKVTRREEFSKGLRRSTKKAYGKEVDRP